MVAIRAKVKYDSTNYDKAMEAVKHLGGGKVSAGILANSAAAKKRRKGVSVLEYAYFHEYGTVNIPARSYLRSTLAEQREKWSRMLMAAVKGRLLEKGILRRAFTKLGPKMEADIRDKINSNIPPPLKPETVTAKMRAKGAVNAPDLALVQYGDLLGAITYEVDA